MTTNLPLATATPATADAIAPVDVPFTPEVAAKEQALLARLRELGGLVVGFSGGVDSTYLLDVAVEALGDRAVAATAVSPSLAPAELDEARLLAVSIGAEHVEVETFEHENPDYRANAGDRCYFCKAELFDRVAPLLDRYDTLAVGTIVDDLGDHRPGQQAARERGVTTPLADAGFTKADVRAASRARGLATWDKPAQACLASRVAYGTEVTPERLVRIAAAEAWLRDRGFRQLRVRDHDDIARVEVPRDRMVDLVAVGAELDDAFRALGWRFVTIDAGGFRSGSMNRALSTEA